MAEGGTVSGTAPDLRSTNRRLTLRLAVVVVAMFGFGYAILPLMYDVVCEITGIGGKPAVADPDLELARALEHGDGRRRPVQPRLRDHILCSQPRD